MHIHWLLLIEINKASIACNAIKKVFVYTSTEGCRRSAYALRQSLQSKSTPLKLNASNWMPNSSVNCIEKYAWLQSNSAKIDLPAKWALASAIVWVGKLWIEKSCQSKWFNFLWLIRIPEFGVSPLGFRWAKIGDEFFENGNVVMMS